MHFWHRLSPLDNGNDRRINTWLIYGSSILDMAQDKYNWVPVLSKLGPHSSFSQRASRLLYSILTCVNVEKKEGQGPYTVWFTQDPSAGIDTSTMFAAFVSFVSNHLPLTQCRSAVITVVSHTAHGLWFIRFLRCLAPRRMHTWYGIHMTVSAESCYYKYFIRVHSLPLVQMQFTKPGSQFPRLKNWCWSLPASSTLL